MTGSELHHIRVHVLALGVVAFGRVLGYQGNDNTTSRTVRDYEQRDEVPEHIARLAKMFELHGVPSDWHAEAISGTRDN